MDKNCVFSACICARARTAPTPFTTATRSTRGRRARTGQYTSIEIKDFILLMRCAGQNCCIDGSCCLVAGDEPKPVGLIDDAAYLLSCGLYICQMGLKKTICPLCASGAQILCMKCACSFPFDDKARDARTGAARCTRLTLRPPLAVRAEAHVRLPLPAMPARVWVHDAATGHRIWRRRRAGGPRGDGALMRSPLTGRSASCPLVRKSARGQGGPDGVRTCKRRRSVYVCLIYAGRSRSRAAVRHRHVTRRAEMIFAPIQSSLAIESN